MSGLGRMPTWLRQQVGSDKAAAQRATPGPWSIHYYDRAAGHDNPEERLDLARITGTDAIDPDGGAWVTPDVASGLSSGDAEHIMLNDPRQVIARCDAVLKLIGSYEELTASPLRLADAELNLQWEVLRRVLKTLADGYRHRDGWDERWTV